MARSLWQRCLGRLREEIPQRQFSQWVTPLQVEETGTEVVLYAPNQYVFDGVSRFFTTIEGVLLTLEGGVRATKVSLLIGTKKFLDASVRWLEARETESREFENSGNTVSSNTGNPNGFVLNPNFRFDNFVQGKSNQLAKAIAMQVAKNPGKTHNPLLIYGGVGLGKTHLMQSVGNWLLEQNKTIKVIYLHSERFVSEMIRAFQNNAIEDFKQYYRSMDVLLIDDIQFFSGKERSQEELFHTFNVLLESNQQIILTSDRFPKEIFGIEERLRSRFGSGLTVAVDPPDFETRVAILLNKSKVLGMRLSQEIAFFMAKKVHTNIREMEGALKRLLASRQSVNEEVSVSLVQEVLKDFLGIQNKIISVDAILKGVAEYYRIRISALLSSKRTREVARPRQMAMALCKELTEASLLEIGEAFGGKDHTTVLHACRQIQRLKDIDKVVSDDFNQLISILVR